MNINRTLYRDAERGKIAGVCAGVAEYFGIELWLVRILVLSAFFLLGGPFVLVAYVAAWFILEKKPTQPKRGANDYQYGGKGWQNRSDEEEPKVAVKAKVWQAGEPPKQAFNDISVRFHKLETRLRRLESYVTSSEFQLNREINRL